jgi:hypothetical protein
MAGISTSFRELAPRRRQARPASAVRSASILEADTRREDRTTRSPRRRSSICCSRTKRCSKASIFGRFADYWLWFGAVVLKWMVDTFHKKYGVQITKLLRLERRRNRFPSTYRGRGLIRRSARRTSRVFGEGFKWHSVLHDRLFHAPCRSRGPNGKITEAASPGELRVKGRDGVFRLLARAGKSMLARSIKTVGFRTGDLFELAGDRLQFYRFVGPLQGTSSFAVA